MSETDNKFQLSGTIKEIFDIQTFPSGFSKQEMVLTIDGDFPQDIKFTAVKDKCKLLSGLHKGFRVTVSFNVKGNCYKDKYYVDLQVWMIKTDEEQVKEFYEGGGQANLVQDDDEPMPF